ncbi:MAG TPA: hypothetical protein RMH26_00810, partial [Polyangiaceae bacterium LLY-WYZ-15_(1-7)]|nr:hypothetical protein [Polyangiaceae bacterium LLY-WYZ-15_(1-7)]
MSRAARLAGLALTLLLAACGDDDAGPAPDAGPTADASAPGCATWTFAPGTGDLSTFPNPEMLAEDAETPTGFRFAVTRDAFPVIEEYGSYEQLFTDQLGDLDGFGVNAAAFARFSTPFDPDALPAFAGADDARLGLLALPADGAPTLVDVEVRTTDRDETLFLIPQTPLPEQAWAALFVTRDLADATVAGCMEASAPLVDALAAPDAETARALEALTELGAIGSPDDLAALVVYPTQTITADSVAVAEHIAARPDEDFALTESECEVESDGLRHCVARFPAADYRDPDGVLRDAEPEAEWELELHVWLPPADAGFEAPYPTALFGHGITASAAGHPRTLAVNAGPRGIAVVGVSAVLHDGHPTGPSPPLSGLDATLAFLAADPETQQFEGLLARDHFRQSTFDKLHVARLLQTGPDFDGDGEPDVDGERLAYVGVSLGGIMGGELLALTDAFSISILGMPGGRISQLITDPMGGFALVRRALIPREWRQGQEDRAFPIIQTILDRGDAASWAQHILARRVNDTEAPHVLIHVAKDDGIVTNGANYAFA